MRIAIVSPKVVGAKQATPETYSSQQLNLARCWVEGGHEVELVSLKGQGLERVDLPTGMTVTLRDGVSLGGERLSIMLGIRSALRGRQFDFVLCSEHYQPATAASCRHSDRVIIYQGQNIQGATKRSRAVMRLLEMTAGRVTRQHACGVVAKTAEAASFLAGRGYRRITTIPCGYDDRRFGPAPPGARSEARQQLGLDPEAVVLVYVGSLLVRRDLPTVIDAHAKLRRRGVVSRLVLVGSGPEREALEEHAQRLGVAGSVSFLGDMPWTELRRVYWAGDFFTFAPRHEIFGLVVPEAMACGLIPACTPVGAGREIIADGETGILFPHGRSDILADRILELVTDPERVADVRAAIAALMPQYRWCSIARRFIEFARELKEAEAGGMP